MRVKIILQFGVRWIVCFLFAHQWNKTLAGPFRGDSGKIGIFKKKHQGILISANKFKFYFFKFTFFFKF